MDKANGDRPTPSRRKASRQTGSLKRRREGPDKETYLTLRLPRPEDKDLLQRRARAAGRSVSEFVRYAILDRLAEPEQKRQEFEARLQLLDERSVQLLNHAEACMRLAASSVVASAMLRDTGRGNEDEAKERVATHIELAVRSAGHVLDLIKSAGR